MSETTCTIYYKMRNRINLSKKVLGTCVAANQLCLILLSTEACNFRCVYCAEKRQHGGMEASVRRGVKNLLSRRAAGLDDLMISWFGGEPLLTRDVVKEVHEHVHFLQDRHPRIRFSADMTTNAYLLSRKVFESLLALGVMTYQITFDGPREWHDRRRVLPTGQGTFDRIWQNVTALREVPGRFKMILRIHVDKDNSGSIPAFVDQCRHAFAGDSRFQIFIRALSRLGGPQDDQFCPLEGGLEDKRIEALRRLVSSQGMAVYTEEKESGPCYAARANCFIIRADGQINKCSIIMEHPGNQVGRLNEDGTMKINQPRMQAWIRGLYTGDADELSCPMRGFQDPCAE